MTRLDWLDWIVLILIILVVFGILIPWLKQVFE